MIQILVNQSEQIVLWISTINGFEEKNDLFYSMATVVFCITGKIYAGVDLKFCNIVNFKL